MKGSKARTERGDFLFKVAEYGGPDYKPFISTEPRRTRTTLVGDSAFLSFDIKAKDVKEAQKIADFLNMHVESVAFTIFEEHPMFGAKLAT
jgi:hypothetical protein